MDVAYGSAGVLPRTRLGVEQRRYLVVANQTLGDGILIDLIRARCSAEPSQLHVLVPHQRRVMPFVDPILGVPMDGGLDVLHAEQQELDQVRARLERFVNQLSEFASGVSGEVVVGDPVSAARELPAGFDEIIVSTLPAGLSAWLRLDLPSRFARSFDVPVVTLTQSGCKLR